MQYALSLLLLLSTQWTLDLPASADNVFYFTGRDISLQHESMGIPLGNKVEIKLGLDPSSGGFEKELLEAGQVLRWEIYLKDKRTPFGTRQAPIMEFSEEIKLPKTIHTKTIIGTLVTTPFNQKGSYKYGIKLIDVKTGKLLIDVDPMMFALD